jgi:hypothetical protein
LIFKGGRGKRRRGRQVYDGREFFIEEIRRLDEFRAQVRAVEWW